MVQHNTKFDKLRENKKFSTRDTSYSSFWLYNRDKEMNNEEFKDLFVNFYNDKELLSEFNPTVAKNIISFWSNEGDRILDPFAGRTRAIISHKMNREYIGYEISKDTYDYVNKRIDDLDLYLDDGNYISLINDDSINIKETFDKEYFDLVFTCPPYWNLEKYQSCNGQLSDIKDYETFMNELVKRLNESAKVLYDNGYMCVVIGDFRRNKKFYSLHSDLIQLLKLNNSIELHDIIAIQNLPFYSAAFYFGSKKKFKYTAKAHEYLLVYKKIK